MNKNILYVILHGSMNPDRYFNVKETWGENVDCLFYSDHEDKDKNIIKVSNRSDYDSNEEKHINALKFVSNDIKDYEWFFFCDDDTFVNTKKLEDMLPTFNSNYVYGSVINCWPSDKSLTYCSGGAGYLINHKLLSKINLGLKNYETGYADVSLGLSLREMNINNINLSLFNSQPPSYYGYDLDEIKNNISFHYIKTLNEMKKLTLKL